MIDFTTKWTTSNDIFETNILILKIKSVKYDIQIIDEGQPPPMYDLIIGLEI